MRATNLKGKPVAAIVVVAAVLSTQANSMDLGEFEYRNSCAQCHGDGGTGAGPMAEYVTDVPSDLTALAKDNGGVFPVQSVYDVIDGTTELGAHGRSMPIWGVRYMVDAYRAADDESADFPFDPGENNERYVRTRILALIEFLSTIQEQ